MLRYPIAGKEPYFFSPGRVGPVTSLEHCWNEGLSSLNWLFLEHSVNLSRRLPSEKKKFSLTRTLAASLAGVVMGVSVVGAWTETYLFASSRLSPPPPAERLPVLEPDLAVVAIEASADQEDGASCSGFLVSERHVLTAAHCLFIEGEPASYLRVIPGLYAESEHSALLPVGSCPVERYHFPKEYEFPSRLVRQKDFRWDFALLELGDCFMPLEGVRPFLLSLEERRGRVFSDGYPGDEPYGTRVHQEGSLVSCRGCGSDRVLISNVKVSEGGSGGVLWTPTGTGERVALAVTVGVGPGGSDHRSVDGELLSRLAGWGLPRTW